GDVARGGRASASAAQVCVEPRRHPYRSRISPRGGSLRSGIETSLPAGNLSQAPDSLGRGGASGGKLPWTSNLRTSTRRFCSRMLACLPACSGFTPHTGVLPSSRAPSSVRSQPGPTAFRRSRNDLQPAGGSNYHERALPCCTCALCRGGTARHHRVGTARAKSDECVREQSHPSIHLRPELRLRR